VNIEKILTVASMKKGDISELFPPWLLAEVVDDAQSLHEGLKLGLQLGFADKYEYEYQSTFVFIFKDFGINFIHIHIHR